MAVFLARKTRSRRSAAGGGAGEKHGKAEADAREALLEQGEEKLAQEKAALEKERTACAAEFAEKRQKLGDAVAALRDTL